MGPRKAVVGGPLGGFRGPRPVMSLCLTASLETMSASTAQVFGQAGTSPGFADMAGAGFLASAIRDLLAELGGNR